jgi:hypothetical protein
MTIIGMKSGWSHLSIVLIQIVFTDDSLLPTGKTHSARYVQTRWAIILDQLIQCTSGEGWFMDATVSGTAA